MNNKNVNEEISTVEYDRIKAGRTFNFISIPLNILIFIVIMLAAFNRYFFYVLEHQWVGVIVPIVAIVCNFYILKRAHRAVVKGRSIQEMVFTSFSCAIVVSIAPILFIFLCYAVYYFIVLLFICSEEEIAMIQFCIYTL